MRMANPECRAFFLSGLLSQCMLLSYHHAASCVKTVSPHEEPIALHAQGFIAVDGTSLTVGEVFGQSFSVYLIPETLRVTNHGSKRVGDVANIEVEAQTQVGCCCCGVFTAVGWGGVDVLEGVAFN